MSRAAVRWRRGLLASRRATMRIRIVGNRATSLDRATIRVRIVLSLNHGRAPFPPTAIGDDGHNLFTSEAVDLWTKPAEAFLARVHRHDGAALSVVAHALPAAGSSSRASSFFGLLTSLDTG